MGSKEDVERQAEDYLRRSDGRYALGTDEHYGRLALAQALNASREGNYGIGAVAVLVGDGTVREYHARSAMVTGLGVVDHAETRALLALRGQESPTSHYPLSDCASAPAEGLSVYGTLEPCPLCVCAMTNSGVRRSVSTAEDGKLVEEDGVLTSDGSASAIGRKRLLLPRVWRQIQDAAGLTFEVLSTEDADLARLSWEIFAVSRDNIDSRLGHPG